MNAEKMPVSIVNAVNSLLEPYGRKFDPNLRVGIEDERKFLDVKTASKYCSLSRWTLARAVASGQLRCSKLGSGQTSKVLFAAADLDAFVRKHTVKAGGKK